MNDSKAREDAFKANPSPDHSLSEKASYRPSESAWVYIMRLILKGSSNGD